MGLLDGLFGLYVADKIMTYVIFCIMGIIMIALLIGLVIYDANTNPRSDDSTVDDNGTHNYQVKIISDGTWEGSFTSKEVNMSHITGSGNRTIDLGTSDSRSIDIHISQSMDSSGNLSAKLYADGKMVDKDSTNSPGGSVLISA